MTYFAGFARKQMYGHVLLRENMPCFILVSNEPRRHAVMPI